VACDRGRGWRRPALDLDGSTQGPDDVDQRLLVPRRNDGVSVAAVDGGEGVAPQQPLVHPVPKRLAHPVPVGDPLDDQQVGEAHGLGPAVDQVERLGEKIVALEDRGERWPDRDDIGAIARSGGPGRVEDDDPVAGSRRRSVGDRRYEDDSPGR